MGSVADFADSLNPFSSGPSVPTSRTVTQAQKDAELLKLGPRPKTTIGGSLWDTMRKQLDASLIVPPPPPPDPSDEVVRKAMANERRRQASMSGSGATALTSPSGLPSLPTLRPPRAGGY